MIKRFLAWLKLRAEAKRLGFPMKIKDSYIYAAGLDLGYTRYQAWYGFIKAEGIKGQVRPMRHNDEVVATYRLTRAYRGSTYSPMGDYAMGDSGENGDFDLERIDVVPLLEGGRR